MENNPLSAFVRFFERLNPDTLESVSEFYGKEARFSDPINQVQGAAQIRHVYAEMFRKYVVARLQVEHSCGDASSGFVKWNLQYQTKKNSGNIPVVSFVRFGEDGLVTEQTDFWDASFPIYGEVPVLGMFMRSVRKLVRTKEGKPKK